MSGVSIMLADDNSAVLGQVKSALEKDYDIVAAVKDGDAVVGECLRLRPNVLILDISMGNVSGIDLARKLRSSGSPSKIVVLTIHEDYDFVNAAIGAGARAYVVKSRLSRDLIPSIEAVLAGKLFVSPSLLHQSH